MEKEQMSVDLLLIKDRLYYILSFFSADYEPLLFRLNQSDFATIR